MSPLDGVKWFFIVVLFIASILLFVSLFVDSPTGFSGWVLTLSQMILTVVAAFVLLTGIDKVWG